MFGCIGSLSRGGFNEISRDRTEWAGITRPYNKFLVKPAPTPVKNYTLPLRPDMISQGKPILQIKIPNPNSQI
ncbi:MAG TPA: hypothetical protein DDW76_22520 [Cyanobacteria bacterium UBA11369]|nr:hypothetical protein [Cyanobacteria bacterium UBA11371]HBE31969.1 hypothetical protein [Cyanobacteria bacterium UBA11368]HBE51475.1 hypothetical protein [Cyanobacteria bacterium UBA11369]